MEIKPTITYPDFEKLDMRVGTIKHAERVMESKKLLRLVVNFGDFERQVIAGIAKEYPDPSLLIDKQAVFLVNLEPRPLAGLVSEAMILVAATDEAAVILQPAAPMPNGSSIQ